jgi:hypothetical protein
MRISLVAVTIGLFATAVARADPPTFAELEDRLSAALARYDAQTVDARGTTTLCSSFQTERPHTRPNGSTRWSRRRRAPRPW